MAKDRPKVDTTTFIASETSFEMTDSLNVESDESYHRESHNIDQPESTSNNISDIYFLENHEKLLQKYHTKSSKESKSGKK